MSASAEAPPCRILITGAGGFAGHHLLPALRGAFPAARLIGASRSGAVAGTDDWLRLDLDDPASLPDAVAHARPNAVLHLAAQSDVGLSFRDPLGTWRTNLGGTNAMAEAVLRAAPGATFLLASSGEVYGLGFRTGLPLDEDAGFAPANPYAASKAAADLAVGEMALRGLRGIRLRPFTHVGPGQKPAFAVSAFARQIARIEAGLQEPVVCTGALDRWRDFLDVRDVCAAYVAALRAAGRLPFGAAFNICSGTPRRIGDILEALLALTGLRVRVEQAPNLLRLTDVTRVHGDPGRAARLLAWTPAVPWDKTLRTVLDDWRVRVAADPQA